jgi:hypothetical protein
MDRDKVEELLNRVFTVNEQIVRQNLQIVSVLTDPRITLNTGWKPLTESETKTIIANAQSYEWAVLMAESTLKEKNGS